MDVDLNRHHGAIEVWTAEERPDLWEAARSGFQDVWPEYNLHGNHSSAVFSALVPQHAAFQVLIYDREINRVVGRGRTVRFHWEGTLDDLPAGFDALVRRTVADTRSWNALSALAAEVATDQQGRGLSQLVLRAMAACARQAGLAHLVAPVRPSWKDRYPLIQIDEYMQWTRQDGLPFDPWIRVHARLGAVTLRPEAKSLLIEAPKADWEEWTAMTFPADGEYIFPAGLAPLRVREGVGTYWEPNVWMRHTL
jgi:GNAT superfamily N-acetyltransferase